MGSAQSSSRPGGPEGTPAAAAAGSGSSGAEKTGAGLLLTCDGEVLLLKRTSRHNFGTWGLPGGNADATDSDLLATATRESREEMGPHLPPFQVVAQLLTKRGKRLQKHYTVFVARVAPQDRAAWQPQLNDEHSEWRWFRLDDLQSPAGANPAGGVGAAGSVPLHPVVELALLAEPHRRVVAQSVGV